MKARTFALALSTALAAAPQALAQDCLEGIYYMANNSPELSRLYSVTLDHPSKTADLDLISVVPIEHGRQLHMAATSDGARLYAVDNPTHVLSVYDVATATWSTVCTITGDLPPGAAVSQAAFSPNDELFIGAYVTGNGIYWVDTHAIDGACGAVLEFAFEDTNGGDLAFSDTGTLYQVNRTSSQSALYEIDLASDTATLVGAVFGDGRVTGTAWSRQGALAGKLLGTIPGASPVGDTLRVLDPSVSPGTDPIVDLYAWTLGGSPFTAVTGGDMANSECGFIRCGDGVVDLGEQCDDGNLVPGDGCDERCRFESAAVPCCVDRDGDGWKTIEMVDPAECGAATVGIKTPQFVACGPGGSLEREDCDDADPAVSPAGVEVPYNGVDENCNGTLTCGAIDDDSRPRGWMLLLTVPAIGLAGMRLRAGRRM